MRCLRAIAGGSRLTLGGVGGSGRIARTVTCFLVIALVIVVIVIVVGIRNAILAIFVSALRADQIVPNGIHFGKTNGTSNLLCHGFLLSVNRKQIEFTYFWASLLLKI